MKKCALLILVAILASIFLISAANVPYEIWIFTKSPPTVYAEYTVPSGILVAANDDYTIDYSNTKDGYIMAKWTGGKATIKLIIEGPTTKYTYNLTTDGEWEIFPLSDGNGKYQIKLCKQKANTKYAVLKSLNIDVELAEEFAPFIRTNQYVNFAEAPNTVAKAETLCKDKNTNLEKIDAIYNYVVDNFTYDYALAATVKSGYVPQLDKVLEKQSGICFDYAAVMTGMARSQNIPCKLVIGYAGNTYHAWISIWSEETGWIDGAIYFDGNEWKRLDPTFASTGNSSEKILKYIDNDMNYTAKYFY